MQLTVVACQNHIDMQRRNRWSPQEAASAEEETEAAEEPPPSI